MTVMPVSVVLPTIGRPDQLQACLESLARCTPRADEVVVVDSSADGSAVASVVAEFAALGVRVVRCEALGVGLAFNVGARAARNDMLLLTNDDCTVESLWIGVGAEVLSSAAHDEIVSGRVRPRGDPKMIPSTIDEEAPRDYTGEIRADAIYTQSLATRRSSLLEVGGFDERIRPSAEDNDLCYRWLKSGRRLRYEPRLSVWHEEWRTAPELEELHVAYWRAEGMFYAKHLRRRDLRMLRFLASAAYRSTRGTVAGIIKGTPRWTDQRRGIARGLPAGLAEGWRTFADARLGDGGDPPLADREGKPKTLPPAVAAEIRRTRRHPRLTQFDYLHARRLLRDLEHELANVPQGTSDVLDIFCGTRPYEDLLPAGSRCTGLDVDDYYGSADVVTRDFLPFADAMFDLVLCTEAFQFVSDPVYGVAEIRRVLRPGGTAIVTVPFVWEYDRTLLEHRFTGPQLAALFADWDDVAVVENGGRGIVWATLTGSIVRSVEKRVGKRLLRPMFAAVYLGASSVGALLEWSERRQATGPMAVPMNLLVRARRPHEAQSAGRGGGDLERSG